MYRTNQDDSLNGKKRRARVDAGQNIVRGHLFNKRESWHINSMSKRRWFGFSKKAGPRPMGSTWVGRISKSASNPA